LMLIVAPKPTPVAQVDFKSRNLKSALVAKLLVFSDFFFDFAFRKCFSFFASKVRPTWQSKVDFYSRISKSAPCDN
jgi:hypothetical protein